jgi:C4-type Zn-finger protein
MHEEERDEEEQAETEQELSCPYCGETVAITVDPAGGAEQEYVEDCPVCCRPWQVHVEVDADGRVHVWADAADE